MPTLPIPTTVDLTVTTLADDPATSILGKVTLRDSITMADAGSTANQYVINFASGLQGTIDLTQALPNLANNISINGPGATSLTVQRDQNAVGFSVFTVDSGETVSISGITITGGNATSGGGIFNYGGTLMVTNCTITDNTASGGSLYGNGEGYVTSSFYGGGAIYSTTGGAITIANSTFTGNTTNGDGGAIYTSGTATVTNSVFTANEAACAGGIFNNGALTVNNSTFANSTGAFYGGGIWNANYDGGGNIPQLATLSVTNCTFTNNAVEGWASQGGGIMGSGTITVSNSTFANNSANNLYNGGGVIAGGSPLTITNCTIVDNSGGGISDGNITINNTIVAGNTGYDISGQITGDNNLIGNGTGITNLPLNSSNLVGTTANPINPMLGSLQNNGGPTETMALLPGSPAINAGSNALAVDANGNQLTTDQRGAGYPRIVNGTVDIGAFEAQSIPTTTAVMTSVSPSTYGQSVTFAATVTSSSTPTGSVEFYDGLTDLGPGTAGATTGTTANWTYTTSTLTAGSHTVQAVYTATGNFSGSTSSKLTQLVELATLTITANNDSKTYGTLKTFSSTAFTETGLVTANGDTITGVTETSTGAAASATVGIYNIVPSAATGTGLSNYTISYISGIADRQPGDVDHHGQQ